MWVFSGILAAQELGPRCIMAEEDTRAEGTLKGTSVVPRLCAARGVLACEEEGAMTGL